MRAEFSLGTPNDKQRLFFLDRHKYVAYGGARGGGKSFAVRKKACLMALAYPGIRIGIFRRTFPELVNNHVTPLLADLRGVADYHEGKRLFRFPGGSTVRMCYCDADRDLDKFQGLEFDVLFIDEATQIPEDWFDKLCACVRGVGDYPKRVYLTCNPGGVGHAWVKRLFITRRYREGENPDDYSFIRALVTDNTALMNACPDYRHRLAALPKKLRDAWLYGSWDLFEGQFFEEFTDDPAHYRDRRYTHVIEPFEIPPAWTVCRSFDWGYAKPFSCDWWAVDEDGRAYLILQYYGCTGEPDVGVKHDPYRVFAKIAEIERTHRWLRGRVIHGVADGAIWDAQTGHAIIEAADACGVYFEKADKRRLPGWMQVHYRLAFDGEGRPMMYFFNTCSHAIRTLPSLCYSRTAPEDLDTAGEDHFADSMRYFCMMRPLRPVTEAPVAAVGIDPLAEERRYERFDYL